MTTSANLATGAIPNMAMPDPFSASPARHSDGPVRYAGFDTEHFSAYSTSSPAHAKRALEAHLKDTDRRIQDASRLGSTLVQQRKDLSARLVDIQQVESENEVPEELRKKLTELEREYNEVGKESARSFLPKSRATIESAGGPAVLAASGRESPTKVTAPSRRQRNQPTNRVHDIEFATEISTSLLAQVRQLQAALAEKDDTLSETVSAKAHMEADLANLAARVKRMDESEQRYKDENWSLETRLQELEASHKAVSDKEMRLNQTLKSTQSEKDVTQRDLDTLKVSHDKMTESHALSKKQQESELHGLRRDIVVHENDRSTMQRKIEELTSQNTELARAMASRWNTSAAPSDREFHSAAEDLDDDDYMPDHSEPASPVKGTPRHPMLESETLKSSLNHAHRMIQNLKNNIHREKTEKLELKRMLQDTRDDLENRRDSNAANMAKKRRSEQDASKFKRPSRVDIGAARSSTTEILEDEPDWEDHDGERTPSRSNFTRPRVYRTDTDNTDDFETATEHDNPTESEAFETGHEVMTGDESDLTETDTNRSTTMRKVSPMVGKYAGDRSSFHSTASTSADEDDLSSSLSSSQPKYKLRMGSRGNKRFSRFTNSSPMTQSPSSSIGTPRNGQTLGDELDAMDEGTPSSISSSYAGTPETQRMASLEPETPSKIVSPVQEVDEDVGSPTVIAFSPNGDHEPASLAQIANEPMHKKAEMVDSGMMTEPWEPEAEHASLRDRAGELVGGAVGGALAGFGLGRLGHGKDEDVEDEGRPATANKAVVEEPAPIQLDHSEIVSQETSPVAAEKPAPVEFMHSDIVSQHTEPIAKELPVPAELKHSGIISSHTEPIAKFVPVPAPFMHSSIISSHTEPSAKEIPVPAAFNHSSIVSQHTEPVAKELPVPVVFNHASIVSQHTEPIAKESPVPASFMHSGIVSQHTEPIAPAASALIASKSIGSDADEDSHSSVPLALGAAAAGAAVAAPIAAYVAVPEQHLDFSTIESQELKPIKPVPAIQHGPVVPKRSSKRLAGQYAADEPIEELSRPSSSRARPTGGFFDGVGAALWPATKENAENVNGEDGDDSPTLARGDNVDIREQSGKSRAPLGELQPNAVREERPSTSSRASTKSQKPKKVMADGDTQTTVTSADIENMLAERRRAATVTGAGLAGAGIGAGAAVAASKISGRPSAEITESKVVKRAASSGSVRNDAAVPAPPLPSDHTVKIAKALKGPPGPPPSGSMGPPMMPASAYKNANKSKANEQAFERSKSPESMQSRSTRDRVSRGQMQSPLSHRSSVSSFASEIDQRFNIMRGNLMLPDDVTPATDPRMIQAITQTMIGEYLWKYTRKAGRSEISSTRHKRFFWVHPYTRTLYWSEHDPSTAGRDMMKAKSVAIETVRIITDDNAYPPGLFRKSIVVITPGREIVFTAPTGQRHETWFNALSYLLLRTGQEREDESINQEDLDEFNPGIVRKSLNKMTGGRSRRGSLSSYNSRTTRTSSPQRVEGSTATRQPQLPNTIKDIPVPTLNPSAASTANSRSPVRSPGRESGRFGSIANRFRTSSINNRNGQPSTAGRYSSTNTRGGAPHDPADIYDASVMHDSAEDLRHVIERQEREADRLENVRACCDGKHDVGSLSHRGGRTSLGGRFSHSHSHAHGGAKSETMRSHR